MALPLIAAAGSGATAAAATTAAGATGLGALSGAAAALGPIGWAALGVAAVSSFMGARAADKAEEYRRFQIRLQERQGRIDAQNTIFNLSRELRYTQGMAQAQLGHGSAGVGESFIALRNDELNLFDRDLNNARLTALGAQSTAQAAISQSRARSDNIRLMSYVDLLGQATSGLLTGQQLAKG